MEYGQHNLQVIYHISALLDNFCISIENSDKYLKMVLFSTVKNFNIKDMYSKTLVKELKSFILSHKGKIDVITSSLNICFSYMSTVFSFSDCW